ncbi:MAG: hypothetical protein NC133_03205 [Prevotella sp.]|nr:hypothetical protein [Prevotella sp.]
MGKTLFFINGATGVGKTVVAHRLLKRLPNAVWLDVDWCCKINPKIINETVSQLRYQHCCYLLNNYLRTAFIENLVFSGAINNQKRVNHILAQLDLTDVTVVNIVLTMDEKAYQQRLQQAINAGERPEFFVATVDGQPVRRKNITYRLQQRHKFEQLDGIKIDTSGLTVEQVVDKILHMSSQVAPMKIDKITVNVNPNNRL